MTSARSQSATWADRFATGAEGGSGVAARLRAPGPGTAPSAETGAPRSLRP